MNGQHNANSETFSIMIFPKCTVSKYSYLFDLFMSECFLDFLFKNHDYIIVYDYMYKYEDSAPRKMLELTCPSDSEHQGPSGESEFQF